MSTTVRIGFTSPFELISGDWMQTHLLDVIALSWFALAIIASTLIVWRGWFVSKEVSSGLWSFVVMGTMLIMTALGLDLAGIIVVPMTHAPTVILCVLALGNMSALTHRLTY